MLWVWGVERDYTMGRWYSARMVLYILHIAVDPSKVYILSCNVRCFMFFYCGGMYILRDVPVFRPVGSATLLIFPILAER